MLEGGDSKKTFETSSVPKNIAFVQKKNASKPAVDVVLGAQWGDEGKGKLVDILSNEYDICARVAGGSNAGHTIVVDVSIIENEMCLVIMCGVFYSTYCNLL